MPEKRIPNTERKSKNLSNAVERIPRESEESSRPRAPTGIPQCPTKFPIKSSQGILDRLDISKNRKEPQRIFKCHQRIQNKSANYQN